MSLLSICHMGTSYNTYRQLSLGVLSGKNAFQHQNKHYRSEQRTWAFAAIVSFLHASASNFAACNSFIALSSWLRASLVSAFASATSDRERASTSAIYNAFQCISSIPSSSGNPRGNLRAGEGIKRCRLTIWCVVLERTESASERMAEEDEEDISPAV